MIDKNNNNYSYLMNTRHLALAVGALLIVGLACGGSSTPPPAAYVGSWTGSDGTSITIRSNGTADYKSGASSVDNGGIAIDEAAKTLKITFAGLGPTYTIDKPPSGDQMTLSGIEFRRSGGGSTSNTSSTSSNTSTGANSSSTQSSPSDLKVPDEEDIRSMVRTTLLDFNDAIQSGDFTGFHKKIAKAWSSKLTPDELKSKFPLFVGHKESFDFAKMVDDYEPTLEPPPTIKSIGGKDVLVVDGSYPTKPTRLKFELMYLMEDGAWRTAGVDLESTDK